MGERRNEVLREFKHLARNSLGENHGFCQKKKNVGNGDQAWPCSFTICYNFCTGLMFASF